MTNVRIAMADDSYFIFSNHSLLFAFRAKAVRETLRLPEITPLVESPPMVAGVVNLRGQIVPILDLDRCFKRTSRKYSLTDFIIVIGKDKSLAGLVVSDIHDVVAIPPAAIEPAERYAGMNKPRINLVTGKAKMGAEILTILDDEKLLELAFRPSHSGSANLSFSLESMADEREIFHKRAIGLLPTPDRGEGADRMALAVIKMGDELFGVELTAVREFSTVKNLAPVPCCPDHVVGNMNLRGNVLTIIDIRHLVGVADSGERQTPTKVIVAALDGLIGVAVDELLDIVYLNPAEIVPVPLAENNRSFKGMAPYGGKMMAVLDLADALASEALVVDEDI